MRRSRWALPGTASASVRPATLSVSFHPNKNITTIEGGCLVMNTEVEAKLAEQYRLQGVVRSGFDGMEVEVVGGKFNLTDVAARVGLGQLPRLQEFNDRRRELARAYFEAFAASGAAGLGLGLPVADLVQSNWHMFQVVLPAALKRAEVMAQLHAAGIGSACDYPRFISLPFIGAWAGKRAIALRRRRFATVFSRSRCSQR